MIPLFVYWKTDKGVEMAHYPYIEGKAGILRDTHKTAEAASYLLAAPEIVTLAKQVLTKETYCEAEKTAIQLAGKKIEKDAAITKLINLVSPPPKRPIYYAQCEMTLLPRWTRDALRYLGDYVDMMVKATVYDKTRDRKVFNNSFGPAINKFKENWPIESELADILNRYNRFLYRPAKHDFILPKGRVAHRFTAREVVLSAYVTMQLGERLGKLSPIAQAV